jgi:hypothetical protein
LATALRQPPHEELDDDFEAVDLRPEVHVGVGEAHVFQHGVFAFEQDGEIFLPYVADFLPSIGHDGCSHDTTLLPHRKRIEKMKAL